MEDKKILVIQRIIIAVLLFLIVTVNIISFTLFFKTKMRVKSYERGYIVTASIGFDEPSKEEAATLVRDLYNTPHSFKEADLNNKNGHADILNEVVYIDENLTISDFIYAYAHELTHIKYKTTDETFVTYKSIITLYESNNHILECVALSATTEILNGCADGSQYDCGYYLIEYFSDKGILKEVNNV